MQIAVRDKDHRVIVVNFLNDGRNRIVELTRDHVPSLA